MRLGDLDKFLCQVFEQLPIIDMNQPAFGYCFKAEGGAGEGTGHRADSIGVATQVHGAADRLLKGIMMDQRPDGALQGFENVAAGVKHAGVGAEGRVAGALQHREVYVTTMATDCQSAVDRVGYLRTGKQFGYDQVDERA